VGHGDRAMSASVSERKKEGSSSVEERYKRINTVQTFDEMTEYEEKKQRSGRLAVISIDGSGFTALRDELCKNLDDQRCSAIN